MPIEVHPFRFTLGPLTITGFGIAMVLAFMIGQYVSESEMERRGIDPRLFADITLGAVVGGLLGAKIYYVILTGAPLFTRDGFVFWGGLIGGLIGTWVVVHVKKLGYVRMGDLAAPGIAAAYAVGRTGCWAVGDDYGRPWNGLLAVTFPDGAPPSTVENMQRVFHVPVPAGTSPGTLVSVYPTQIFEVTLALLMFAILWRLRDHKHAAGWLFGLYFALAGAERFIIEFFRAKDDRFFGPLTVAQMFALAFVVAGLVWMRVYRTTGPGRPGIFAAGASSAT